MTTALLHGLRVAPVCRGVFFLHKKNQNRFCTEASELVGDSRRWYTRRAQGSIEWGFPLLQDWPEW